jgi:hypothetical protein
VEEEHVYIKEKGGYLVGEDATRNATEQYLLHPVTQVLCAPEAIKEIVE